MNKELLQAIKDEQSKLTACNNRNEFLVNMHTNAGNLLVKHIKFDLELTRKYTQAMSFLSWFKEHKPIHSNKLELEVMATKHSDLTKYHTFHDYKDVKFTNIEDVDNNEGKIKITSCGIGNTAWNGESIGELVTSACNNLYYRDHNIDSISIGDQTIKINYEKPEEVVKYEDTISYVIECPFNFDEGTIIAVYNYLKKMIEKDKEIEKYENKSESSKKGKSRDAK